MPRLQGLKLASLSEVRYKGDDLQRPIASNEIGWLVRLLVWLSLSLNQAFQLGPAATGSPDAPELLVSSPCHSLVSSPLASPNFTQYPT